MSCLSSPHITDLDVEAFQHMLVTARSVSICRPVSLVKFAETEDANQGMESQANNMDHFLVPNDFD